MRQWSHDELAVIRASVSIERIAGDYGIALKKKGNEFVGLCPFHNERSPSFTVVPAKHFWHCFGCSAHGDVFDLVERIEGKGFGDAVEWLAELAGINRAGDRLKAEDRARIKRETERRAAEARAAADARDRREREFKAATALEIWRSGGPATGTLVEVYLAARGIDVAAIGGVPRSIRFSPAAAYALRNTAGDIVGWQNKPVMIAAIQGPESGIIGVHRTWLAPDGKGKDAVGDAKMMLGKAWGGAVRLSPAAPVLAIGEGIETTLSAVCAMREADRELAAWAALSLGNIAGGGLGKGPAHPDGGKRRYPSPLPDPEQPGIRLPAEVREVVILADADGKDPVNTEMLLTRAARRFEAEGRRVRIARPPAGMDFNDWLRSTRPAAE